MVSPCGSFGVSKTKLDKIVIPDSISEEIIIPEQREKIAGKKWCPQCQDYLTYDCFHTDKGRGDGLKALCRIHWNISQKKLYWKNKARYERTQLEKEKV